MDSSNLHLHWGECRYKGKKYRSYSLARSFRRDGKNRKEIVLKLGALSDDEVLKWKALLAGLKDPQLGAANLDEIIVTRNYSFLDVALVNDIWNSWGFDDLFSAKGNRIIDVATVARILTINRCLDPLSKRGVVEWLQTTALPQLLAIDASNFNSSRIYRDLDLIEQSHESLAAHIFSKLRREKPKSLESVFFDLTTSTFHGSKCVLVKWGKAKRGYEDHVVLALVVSNEGIPFHWEVLTGGTHDTIALEELINGTSKKFAIDNLTLVFDRGMVSDANLKRLERKKIKYITACDKPQIERFTDFNFQQVLHFKPEEIDKQLSRRTLLERFDDVTYFRECGIKDGRRYILGFNMEIFKAQREIRQRNINEFFDYIDSLNLYLDRHADRPRQNSIENRIQERLQKYNLADFFQISVEPRRTRRYHEQLDENMLFETFHVKASIDEAKKLWSGRLDGFWMLVTNHVEKDLNPDYVVRAQNIIKSYRDKYVVEDAFRDVKSFVDVAPTFVWRESHVKAHYTICVLAHLINRVVALKLKETKSKTTNNIDSAEAAYRLLSNCKLNSLKTPNAQTPVLVPTQLTREQTELLSRLSLKPPLPADFKGKKHKKDH